MVSTFVTELTAVPAAVVPAPRREVKLLHATLATYPVNRQRTGEPPAEASMVGYGGLQANGVVHLLAGFRDGVNQAHCIQAASVRLISDRRLDLPGISLDP